MHNELLAHALQLHRQGQLQPAMKAYEELLKLSPDDASALHGLGVAKAQAGMHEEALAVLEKATKIHPAVSTHLQLARLHMHMDKPILAIAEYDKVIAIDSVHVQAHLELGQCLVKTGQFYSALNSFQVALKQAPENISVFVNLTECYALLHQYSAANKVLGLALRLAPQEPRLHSLAQDLQNNFKAHRSRLLERVKPHHLSDPAKLFNAGKRLKDAGKPKQALEFFDAVLAIDPKSVITLTMRGLSLFDQRRIYAAIESFDRVSLIDPGAIDAFLHCGGALFEMRHFNEAIDQFQQVLLIDAHHPDALFFIASALQRVSRYREAIEHFEQLLRCAPNRTYLHGELITCQLYACSWAKFLGMRSSLLEKISDGELSALPLQLLAVTDNAALQLKLARKYLQFNLPHAPLLPPLHHTNVPGSRTKVGYFSMDFSDHPVSYLTAELLELHDRSKFEIFAFSFGELVPGSIQDRIKCGVDRFIDVQEKTDSEIALFARSLGIDVAVDLAGYTANARPGIFNHRAAPVQINYLGYPGTLGNSHIDYIVGDRNVIPLEYRVHYQEKVIDLPCYQVTDSTREVRSRIYQRLDFDLPNDAIVFCCFNSCHKISPEMFACWMDILEKVPGSYLFLYAPHSDSQSNLTTSALKLGVDPGRLRFGEVISPADNLARYTCTDLFLDTFPFNAGTTASDALWAGVPVLTLAGEAFASRMATSLVHAVGLPELSVTTLEDYRAMAIALGNDRQRLQALKQRLAEQRLQASVFRTKDQARRLEDAFEQALQRFRKGLPPADIQVT